MKLEPVHTSYPRKKAFGGKKRKEKKNGMIYIVDKIKKKFQ